MKEWNRYTVAYMVLSAMGANTSLVCNHHVKMQLTCQHMTVQKKLCVHKVITYLNILIATTCMQHLAHVSIHATHWLEKHLMCPCTKTD